MSPPSGKRIAKVKKRLGKRQVETLRPRAKPWIAWDDRLPGFGVRVQPSGCKSFIVNYRPGNGGRNAPNRRIVIGRYGAVEPARARKLARELLGRVAAGEDPAEERAEARRIPTLNQAFADYLAANPNRKPSTESLYRGQMGYCFSDWLSRPLSAIERKDVEGRFFRITERHGRAVANHAISLLRSVYRRLCVDHASLRNPVEQWIDGGGRYHPSVRRKIAAPSEVLPRWRAAIEAEVHKPSTRDIFWIALYTGMRRGEIMSLGWDRLDFENGSLRVEDTKSGAPLVLPFTRQLAAILQRRAVARGPDEWVFPSSTSASGHMEQLQHLHFRIEQAAGIRFWFHGLRNCFISVAERELMLPRPLTKRLVGHSSRGDVTEGYAAEWTLEQLREPAQQIADRIDELSFRPAS